MNLHYINEIWISWVFIGWNVLAQIVFPPLNISLYHCLLLHCNACLWLRTMWLKCIKTFIVLVYWNVQMIVTCVRLLFSSNLICEGGLDVRRKTVRLWTSLPLYVGHRCCRATYNNDRKVPASLTCDIIWYCINIFTMKNL